MQNIFEQFKRTKKITRTNFLKSEIFFQLDFDEFGAFLKIVDTKGKIIEPNYQMYSGHTRELLKAIGLVQTKNSFQINWEASGSEVYLHENEFLLWQLPECKNLVNAQMKPLVFVQEEARIILTLEKEKDILQSEIKLLHKGKSFNKIKFLNENHVLSGNKIFQTQALSENFNDILSFETTIFPDDLELFLSLLFSFFEKISVCFEDYEQEIGTPQTTKPSLIFEKIDEDNSLFLKVSASLKGFESDILENYDLSKIATLNELEKKIILSEVIFEDVFTCQKDIENSLKKYRKNLKTVEQNEFFLDDNLFIIEENLAKEFIRRELPNLVSNYAIFGSEKLRDYKIRTSKPKLNLSLAHGIDFLEGDASLEIEGETISLFDALNQFKKNSYIQLSDGTSAIVNQNYINKLNRIFKKQKENVKVSFFDLPLVEELIDEKVAQESFAHSKEIFLGFNKLKSAKIQFPKVNAKLRAYQKQGFKWINYLHKNSLGGCLADDMGLGKTLQTIVLLSKIYPKEKLPTLIIMPKSLLFNWGKEIEKFNPNLSFCIHHGTSRNFSEAKKSNLIFSTYATIRNDIEELKDEKFYYTILDESQNIKNLNAQTTKAVMLLQSKFRLALSGTPIENNLGELYSLFRFLNPSMFGSADEFNRNYLVPIQRENDKEALSELKKKIYPFILRRLKKDVLKDLPDKIEQVLYVEMTPKQKRLYEEKRKFFYETVNLQIAQNGIKSSQFFILQALSELRQIASFPESKSNGRLISPKREMLLENILDLIANGHKVLIFANFLSSLENVAKDLEANGIDFLTMTGATRNRQELVDKFQTEDTHKVFLMTLKTGGIGLNLTNASYIFILEPWWNKSAENQAIDRTHRIGQDKTVFAYKIITKGTIEEKILRLQEMKSELFENLISSDGASIKSLDEKDVQFILGGETDAV